MERKTTNPRLRVLVGTLVGSAALALFSTWIPAIIVGIVIALVAVALSVQIAVVARTVSRDSGAVHAGPTILGTAWVSATACVLQIAWSSYQLLANGIVLAAVSVFAGLILATVPLSALKSMPRRDRHPVGTN